MIVVSIGRLTAFYFVLAPLELIPSETPLYNKKAVNQPMETTKIICYIVRIRI